MWPKFLFGSPSFAPRPTTRRRHLEVEQLECRDQPAVLIVNPLVPIFAPPINDAPGQFAALPQAQTAATNALPPAALPPSVGSNLPILPSIPTDLFSLPQAAPIGSPPFVPVPQQPNALSSVPESIRAFSQLGFLSGVAIPTRSLSEIGRASAESLRILSDSFSAPEISDAAPPSDSLPIPPAYDAPLREFP